MLLTDFTQPQAGSRRAAQFAVLLQDEVFSPEASRGSSACGGQLPGAVLWWGRVFSDEQGRGFCGRGPLDVAELDSLHGLPEGQAQIPHPSLKGHG